MNSLILMKYVCSVYVVLCIDINMKALSFLVNSTAQMQFRNVQTQSPFPENRPISISKVLDLTNQPRASNLLGIPEVIKFSGNSPGKFKIDVRGALEYIISKVEDPSVEQTSDEFPSSWKESGKMYNKFPTSSLGYFREEAFQPTDSIYDSKMDEPKLPPPAVNQHKPQTAEELNFNKRMVESESENYLVRTRGDENPSFEIKFKQKDGNESYVILPKGVNNTIIIPSNDEIEIDISPEILSKNIGQNREQQYDEVHLTDSNSKVTVKRFASKPDLLNVRSYPMVDTKSNHQRTRRRSFPPSVQDFPQIDEFNHGTQLDGATIYADAKQGRKKSPISSYSISPHHVYEERYKRNGEPKIELDHSGQMQSADSAFDAYKVPNSINRNRDILRDIYRKIRSRIKSNRLEERATGKDDGKSYGSQKSSEESDYDYRDNSADTVVEESIGNSTNETNAMEEPSTTPSTQEMMQRVVDELSEVLPGKALVIDRSAVPSEFSSPHRNSENAVINEKLIQLDGRNPEGFKVLQQQPHRTRYDRRQEIDHSNRMGNNGW